jgi:hypothetical protein
MTRKKTRGALGSNPDLYRMVPFVSFCASSWPKNPGLCFAAYTSHVFSVVIRGKDAGSFFQLSPSFFE